MNYIHEFLTDLLIQSGFEHTDINDLIEELEPILIEHIINKISIKLTPNDIKQAEKFLAQGKSEAFHEMCEKNIPDYDQYMVSVLMEFETNYLSHISK